MLKKLTIALIFIFVVLAGRQALAVDNFNPGYIISDQEILNTGSMNAAQIQKFLEKHNSFLAGYLCTDNDGNEVSSSYAIYDRAVTNGVSPKFLLTLIQKEQSLVEDPAPTDGQLDWAAGYGCPDGGGCNAHWQGFWKQINSAGMQFRDYMDNPQLYTYKAGGTYVFANTNAPSLAVTIQNQATAGLYNYTPHVYNGNFNFWNIWNRYFARVYPNGSLLTVSSSSPIWLIDNGVKRMFLSEVAFDSRFDKNKIIIVNQSDLDLLPTGTPLKFEQYSIVQVDSTSSGPILYLLVDNTKREIADQKTFRHLGYDPSEIITASSTDLEPYQDGEPIVSTSTYPTGALLQDRANKSIFWVINNTKAPLIDKVYLTAKFKGLAVTKVAATVLKKYSTVAPVMLDDGNLLKGDKASRDNNIYLIADGQKRRIVSLDVFNYFGYKMKNVITVPKKVLQLYVNGPDLSE